MGNEDEGRKVVHRCHETTTVMILIDQIIRNQQINLLLIALTLKMLGPRICKRKRSIRGDQWELLDRIPDHVKYLDRLVRVSDRSCIDNLRMDRNTFGRLCRLLRGRAGLIDQKFVTVEEQVAMFLCVLSHHKKLRVVCYDFMRSSQTVSRYVHIVFRGVLTLHNLFLVKPTAVGDDCTDRRWKWFKGALEL
ncbi:uncharacterized protein LOC125218892 [Salvia hispanica]|uniref:uncharacterized protein LOC125218892 n=1 Tax=Salvia hispanica TaxID=49212 RepID=UPI002008EFF1|nr:uncharacterized protein LOC125218892 [Salvia hispanica]